MPSPLPAMPPPDRETPDHETVYQLVYEQRWGDLLDVVYRHREAVAADALLAHAVATFLDAYFRELAAEEVPPDGPVLEKLFLLHTGHFYRLGDARFTTVVERLVALHASRPEAAAGYARFCPGSPACAAVLARHGRAAPAPVPQAQPEQLTLSESPPLGDADHRRSLFKSQQEVDFFLAMREVFATYLVYPNVALSSVVDFEPIRDRLTPAERQYFFRGVVDCVVFDQHDAYRPRYFFELDSPLHDAEAQRTRDRHKDHILALAGCTLYRVRPHKPGLERTAYVALIRSLDLSR